MMVIPGVGVGWGDGNIWASADDTAPIARAKATAMARSALRRAPVSPACEGRDAQRINSNPTGRPARTNARIPCRSPHDLPPVRRKRQSLGNPLRGQITGVVVGRPQVAK